MGLNELERPKANAPQHVGHAFKAEVEAVNTLRSFDLIDSNLEGKFVSKSVYVELIKPVFERLAALVLLLLLLPAMVLVALVLLFVNRGRVFFCQERVGYQGRVFTIMKFRSSAPSSVPGPNAHYTPLGKWMRRYHVDELPQLWNVIAGEMSLVGPRPLLASDLVEHAPTQMQGDNLSWRHAVKPGLTGLVQVSGGKYLPWAQRFALDAVYVANLKAVGVAGDWAILRSTLSVSMGGAPKAIAPFSASIHPTFGRTGPLVRV